MYLNNAFHQNLLREWKTFVINNRGWASSTISCYKSKIELLLHFCDRYQLGLNSKDIKQLLLHYFEYYSTNTTGASTYNKAKAAIESFLHFLVVHKHMEELIGVRVPDLGVRRRRPVPGPLPYITQETYMSLLKATILPPNCALNISMGRTKALMACQLLLTTGMRRSELVALTPEDINYNHRSGQIVIAIRKPKNHKPREVFSVYSSNIPSLQDIRLLHGVKPKEKIFNVCTRTIQKAVKAITTYYFGVQLKCHDMRRHSAELVDLLGNGKDTLQFMQHQLGHSDISLTARYARKGLNHFSEFAKSLAKSETTEQ